MIGPLVTPLSRRRVAKLARETASLDRLSDGRLVLGRGIGSDRHGELVAFGEVGDVRTSAACSTTASRGCRRSGRASSSPASAAAADPGVARGPLAEPPPVRRAANWDGLFPIDLPGPEALAELVAEIAELRGPEPGRSTSS